MKAINESVQGDAQSDGEGIKGWGAHTPLGLEDVNEGDRIVLILMKIVLVRD